MGVEMSPLAAITGTSYILPNGLEGVATSHYKVEDGKLYRRFDYPDGTKVWVRPDDPPQYDEIETAKKYREKVRG